VTGPRGSGKTRLINTLLADPAFVGTAVILNDFGATELTGAAVQTAAADNFVAFGAGCVCCTVRGALTDGLEDLLRGLDNNRVAGIARVIIEADETADPTAIVAAVMGHPYLSLRFIDDGIVAVLRADTAASVLTDRFDTARQVASADVVVLTGDGHATAPVAAIAPFAKIAPAASVNAADVTGHAAFEPADGDIDAWLALPPARRHAAEGQAARMHTYAVARDRTMSFADLDQFLTWLMMLQGTNLIRVRGAVATGEAETTIVDWLGSHLRPPVVADRVAGAAVRFTITSSDLDAETFATYLDAFLNEARIDTPDRAAITANPLAIAGFSSR
jgi:G3E family GTPase